MKASSTAIADTLLREKVIAVLRGIRPPRLERVVAALRQGGVRFIEITVEGDGATDALRAVRTSAGDDVVLGAGTVTTVPQAEAAVAAGATYLISPGFVDDVSDYANARDILYIPGVLTATEVGVALRKGHRILKLFPAGLVGVEYLRALQAPYPEAKFFAVGNIGTTDVAAFLAGGAAGVAMGSQLAGRGDEPETIAVRARAIVTAIREMARA
ncbi:MAG: bifunctional 4-hydroxy-2-oxoglutarate aldolase/2-dehydro-3-deoxy-phosphogluconate aldolase [Armatimonadota bacterium]|nr:bifunctional 4-hydroxy-2-oxoglutarate aldolase/2-dehydro-3-deoxy-phosphogluconate aldolase [Armatimonadota bacterium]